MKKGNFAELSVLKFSKLLNKLIQCFDFDTLIRSINKYVKEKTYEGKVF